MTAYRVEPAQVAGVLQATATRAETLGQQVKDIGVRFEGAAINTGSPIVAEALMSVAEAAGRDLSLMFDRTMQCLECTVAATKALLANDLEMAANAQRKAGSSWVTDGIDFLMKRGDHAESKQP